jgi:hypothetical protein
MRLHDLSKVLALSLALAAPFGGALAQGTASHQVSVSIPTVLRLRIDDATVRDRAALDIAVTVAGDRVRIEPGTTRIEVRANADWALDVRYLAASNAASVPLGATLDGSTWHRLVDGARLATGAATGGWRPLEVRYGLLASLSDGTYRGTVVYTLTQP